MRDGAAHVEDFPRREAPNGRAIRLVPFDNITLNMEAYLYLIKGIIPRQGLVVFWGPPKSGKSFKVFDLGMHIALGWSYRGRRVQHGPVIYGAFEGQAGLEARVEAFRQSRLHAHDGPVQFYVQPVTMNLVQDHAELVRVIDETLVEPPVLVILDTLNRSLEGSEASDEDMGAYVRAADAIRVAFGCVVGIVHHCGIDGTRPRGHTSLTGAADVQIKIARDAETDVISMVVELAKDGPQGDVITSRLDVIEVGQDADGDPITSCVVVPAEVDPKSRESRLPEQSKVALRALRMALEEIGEPSPGGDRYPAKTRVVGMSGWMSYFDKMLISESDNPDTRKKAFVRASRRLQEVELVGVWAERCWLNEPSRTRRT